MLSSAQSWDVDDHRIAYLLVLQASTLLPESRDMGLPHQPAAAFQQPAPHAGAQVRALHLTVGEGHRLQTYKEHELTSKLTSHTRRTASVVMSAQEVRVLMHLLRCPRSAGLKRWCRVGI